MILIIQQYSNLYFNSSISNLSKDFIQIRIFPNNFTDLLITSVFNFLSKLKIHELNLFHLKNIIFMS